MGEVGANLETRDQRTERRKREREDRKFDIRFDRSVQPDGTVVDKVEASLRPGYEAESFEDSSEPRLVDQAEYERRMAEIATKREEIARHGDYIATILANTQEGMARIPQEGVASLRELQKVVNDAANGSSPEHFADLPEELRKVIERADRILEMHHIMTGSTHQTPMDGLYSHEAAVQYVDDFCGPLESSLSRLLNESLAEQGINHSYRLEIGRPQHPASINAIPNLVDASLRRALDGHNGINKSTVLSRVADEAMAETAAHFTQRS